jgi:hypothetical protein
MELPVLISLVLINVYVLLGGQELTVVLVRNQNGVKSGKKDCGKKYIPYYGLFLTEICIFLNFV